MYFSQWTAVVLTLLFSHTWSLRVPVKDVRQMGMNMQKREENDEPNAALEAPQLEKRLTCVYDGVLQGMLNDKDDAVPFCSSYLGIKDATATTTVTSKTTTTSLVTYYQTEYSPTVTQYAGTVTVTVATLLDKAKMVKRADSSSAAVTPFASLAAACTLSPLNATLISKVSSGCSCLKIQPNTDYVTATVTTTKLLSGFDEQETVVPTTVQASGTTTVTVTFSPPPKTSDLRTQTFPTSVTVPTSVSSIPSSFLQSSIYSIANSTGPVGTGSGTGISSSATVPIGTGSSTSSGGSYTGVYTGPSSNSRDGLSSGTPSASVSGVPSSYNLTSVAATSPSSISRSIVPATNTSSSSPSPSPTGLCPYQNNTIYTTDEDKLCQKFQILCYRNFNGPTYLGLHEQSLNDCIEDCATINVGFSEDRCYGLTYNASESADKNCFFRKKEDLGQFVDDPLVIAALLIANDTCASSTSSIPYPANSTRTPYPTGSLSISGPPRDYTSLSTSASIPISANATSRFTTGPLSPSRSLGTASTGYLTNSYNITSSLPVACGAASTVTTNVTVTSISTVTYIETIIPKPPTE